MRRNVAWVRNRIEGDERPAWLATAVLASLAAVLVWLVATRIFPYHSLNHDEAVYLQQAGMLLSGQFRLYPPLDDVFRPWFFVDAGDHLYPKYAPVPAAVFALGRLAGSSRLALAAVAAGNVALVAAVVREAFDRRTGLLAAAFVLCSPLFVVDSAVFLPYAPTTLLNLSFAYAYLRANRTAEVRWAAVAGGAVGLAFFSRPYTAVLFAAPFLVHACWTLWADWRAALPRQATTAALGLVGVGLALGYNALLTGSPWLFPYEAFAPEDGLGFGHREILAHEVEYTVELALRANRAVVTQFATEWITGGVLGAALAGLGLVAVARRRPSAEQATLAGLFASIVAGNVYFWGNFNILGDVDTAGDGLIAALGPYYHFDLLLPTATFAAVGALAGLAWVRDAARAYGGPRLARVALAVVLLVGVAAVGTTTAEKLDDRLERNVEVTETYERAYAPFADGAPENAVVLLPTPYGDWLNHPFQVLRNDPDFDGPAVYAVDDRPFAVADEYPDRRLYRYVYRGAWAPSAGSPESARLQRVEDVEGRSVRLDADLGVPDGALGATVRVGTDEGSTYYVAENVSESLAFDVTVADGSVSVDGDVRAVGNGNLAVSGRDTVHLTVFVDYAGGGFTYRFDLPVDAADGRVRALSPRVEYCRAAQRCGGAAAYVPESAPPGVSVSVDLTALERNP